MAAASGQAVRLSSCGVIRPRVIEPTKSDLNRYSPALIDMVSFGLVVGSWVAIPVAN